QEYDLGQAKALAFQNVLGAAIIVFMHLKWGYLRPMLLQSVLGLRTLSAAPIVQVYLFGKPATGDLARPW
ncbi:inorganic phosphate transporter Pho88, partial [Gorgonomyces haynaldii]